MIAVSFSRFLSRVTLYYLVVIRAIFGDFIILLDDYIYLAEMK